MPNPSSQLAVVATVAPVNTGAEQEAQITRLGSLRVAQLEEPGFELGRIGRTFTGGIQAVAAGIVPVVDLPTTLGPMVLYNSNPVGGKNYQILRVSAAYASGTLGVAGFGLFGGVTPAPLATALVANTANCSVQAARGYGLVTGYIGLAKTIATGTAWMHLGGIITLGAAVTGPAFSTDVVNYGFIVPPTYAFTLGVLSDLGTTAKYVQSIAWCELEGDLP